MKKDSKWFLSIETRSHHYKLSIYDNGLVYGKNRNERLCVLKDEAMQEIRNIITPSLPFLRKERYVKDEKGAYIIRINITSRKHPDCIKVINPEFDKIMDILIDKNNHLTTF